MPFGSPETTTSTISSASHARFLRRGPAVICGVVIAVALLDLVGWWTGIEGLAGHVSSSATMKPNTAAMLILLSVATLGRERSARYAKAADLLCMLAAALTGATLLEYLTGWNPGIDQMLAHVPADPHGLPTGRMSFGTALNGLLLALGLLLMDALPWLGGLLAACAGLISLSALVGFAFDAGPLYGVPLLRSMAIKTAACFFALEGTYCLLRPRREPVRSLLRDAVRHRSGARFMLATCLLPLVLGLPIAAMYRHGQIEAMFSFAMLVVLLMATQAALISANNRSLEQVEQRRDQAERERELLAAQIRRQCEDLIASEARAARSEALYRLITDALPVLVAYLNRDLRYVRVNQTYEAWFGVAAAGLEGKSLDAVMKGATLERIRQHLEIALTGRAQQFEVELETVQGERLMCISQIPDRDEAGLVRGVIVQGEDITSRKQSEQALRQTEKLAAVGRLASSIAHEINNPLEAVTNLLYLANSEAESAQTREYLTKADQELRRVSVIANQTLLFHKQATKPAMVRAEELFRNVRTIYEGKIQNARIQVEERHRAAEPITCLDGEIRQVLNNLVGNAIDAMGGRAGRILLRSAEAKHWQTGEAGVVLTVADDGSGMNKRTLDNLFEAFFTTKGMNGTGLGLWVSREIIDRHHGSVKVKSQQAHAHHGTVFRLFLPHAEGGGGTPMGAPPSH